MSVNGGDEVEYMVEEDDMINTLEEEMDEELLHVRGAAGNEVENEYELLTRVTDTSSAQARRGKDIQGIQWDRLNITRQDYRRTRIESYKNYENVPSSGDLVDKECKQVEKGGNFYEFRYNSRVVKPTILHFQLRNLVWATSKHNVYLMSNNAVIHWSPISRDLSEVLNFSGLVAPSERYQGSLLEGFTGTQISTLAVKDSLLVAGGFQGELICKARVIIVLSACFYLLGMIHFHMLIFLYGFQHPNVKSSDEDFCDFVKQAGEMVIDFKKIDHYITMQMEASNCQLNIGVKMLSERLLIT